MERLLIGIVGLAGLAVGVWVVTYEKGRGPGEAGWRDRFRHWLFSLDSLMAAFGWVSWMGVFGGLVALSVTGQTLA